MSKLIAIALVLFGAYRLVVPSVTAIDILGAVVIVPCLTAVFYRVLGMVK